MRSPGEDEVWRDPHVWRVNVFQPFAMCRDVTFGRIAARSDAFSASATSDDGRVIIGSAAGADPENVVTRAQGELRERVSNILAGRAVEAGNGIIASFAELHGLGRPALDPASWHELAARADVRQETMLWVAGQSLVTKQEVLVPASAVFLRHRPPPGCAAPLRAGSAGLSAHCSWQAAVRHALLEVIERDLVSRSWYKARSGTLLLRDPQLSPVLSESLRRLELVPTALAIPGPSNIASVVVCLHTAERRSQSFGARCVIVDSDASLFEAINAAAYEALMVRWSMDTPIARRAWQRLQSDDPPFVIRGALEHALFAFHRQDSLTHWIMDTAVGGWQSQSARPPPGIDEDWQRLAWLLSEHTAEDVVVVNTSEPAACFDDVTVVRIVAPGAHRLPAVEPYPSTDQRCDKPKLLPHPLG